MLVACYVTGHADPHVHALVGLLFMVLLVAHGVVSHRKIAQTTRHVACKGMSRETRIDCCLGLAMVVLLAIVLFGETENLAVKLVGCVGILVGTLMMIERRQQDHDVQGR